MLTCAIPMTVCHHTFLQTGYVRDIDDSPTAFLVNPSIQTSVASESRPDLASSTPRFAYAAYFILGFVQFNACKPTPIIGAEQSTPATRRAAVGVGGEKGQQLAARTQYIHTYTHARARTESGDSQKRQKKGNAYRILRPQPNSFPQVKLPFLASFKRSGVIMVHPAIARQHVNSSLVEPSLAVPIEAPRPRLVRYNAANEHDGGSKQDPASRRPIALAAAAGTTTTTSAAGSRG